MTAPKIPDWMKVVADGSIIGAEEIAQIWGCHASNIPRNIERGEILKESFSKEERGRTIRRWYMRDVRQHIKNLNKG